MSDTQASEAQEPVPATTDEATEPKPKEERSGGSGIRWILILIVIGALAAFGWWFKQQNGNEPAAESTSATAPAANSASTETAPTRIEPTPTRQQPAAAAVNPAAQIAPDVIPAATQADIDALSRDIAALRNELADARAQLADQKRATDEQTRLVSRLRSEQSERLDLMDSLPGRVRNTEEAVARLQGISAGSQRAWLLAEAEYYMQLANAQLQLANNPELATEALKLADQRVRELADPAFTPVRRALAEEITSLASLSTGDVEGASLTIGSLMSMVDRLPIDQGIRVSGDGESEATADSEATGWARMREKFGSAMGSFVRVRKSSTPLEPLLPPEAESFLRLNLKLQLQSARSALLLGEQAAYRQGLADVRDWVQQYFDTEDGAVINLLEMLDEVDDAQRASERPDISGSLTLLREQLDVKAESE